MDINDQIKSIIDDIYKIFGLKDEDFDTNSVTWSMLTYKPVIMAKSLLSQRMYGEAVSKLDDFVSGCMETSLSSVSSSLFEDEKGFDERMKVYNLFRNIKLLKGVYEDSGHQDILDNLRGSSLFSDEELNIKDVPIDIYGYVEDTFNEKLVTVGIYKDGGDVIPDDVQFIITPQITLSTTITHWMEHLEKNPGEEGIVRLSLFLMMDDVQVEYYSSFYLGIQYKNTIWVATDQLVWNNPRNKAASRKPDRHRERHYEKVMLPYGITHHITEVRKGQTGVTRGIADTYEFTCKLKDHIPSELHDKCNYFDGGYAIITSYLEKLIREELKKHDIYPDNVIFNKGPFNDPADVELKKEGRVIGRMPTPDGVSNLPRDIHSEYSYTIYIYTKPEILKVDLKDTLPIERAYTLLLFQRLVDGIREDHIKPVHLTTPNKHIDQKLLSGETIDVMEKNDMLYNDARKQFVEEILEGYEVEPTKAIIHSNEYGLIKTSRHYNSELLVTPAQVDRLLPWFPAEDEFQAAAGKISSKATSKHRDDAKNEVDALFYKNWDRIVDITTMGKEGVYLKHNSLKHVSFGSMHGTGNDTDELTLIASIVPKEQRKTKWFPGFTVNYIGGIPKEDYCCSCEVGEEALTKQAAYININHWSHLTFLFGMENRMELPMYYRNYRRCWYVPYNGNSILDHVHPVSLISDPLSRDKPNGIRYGLTICGNCLWSRIKGKPDYVIIDKDLNILDSGGKEIIEKYKTSDHTSIQI